MATYSGTSSNSIFDVTIITTSTSITVTATGSAHGYSSLVWSATVAGVTKHSNGNFEATFSRNWPDLNPEMSYGVYVYGTDTAGHAGEYSNVVPLDGSGGGTSGNGGASNLNPNASVVTGGYTATWATDTSYLDYGGGGEIGPCWEHGTQMVTSSYGWRGHEWVWVKCISKTVTDTEITFKIRQGIRTCNISNWPYQGLNITYTDEDNNTQLVGRYTATTTGEKWDTATYYGYADAGYYYRSANTDYWDCNDFEITYQRKTSAYTRQAVIELYNTQSYTANVYRNGEFQGVGTFSKFKFTFTLNLPVDALSGKLVEALSESTGTAKVTYNGSDYTQVLVPNNTSVTFTATPGEDYVFEGWHDSDTNTLISTANPYTTTITNNLSLRARFEEDNSSKATHLYEPVTQKTYQLQDSSLARVDSVTITTDRIARWRSASDKIASGYTLTYASSVPSSVTNGSVYATVIGDFPDYSSWQYGNWIDYDGDDARTCLKVTLVSETATKFTIRINASSQCPSYHGWGDYCAWGVSVNDTQIAGDSSCSFQWGSDDYLTTSGGGKGVYNDTYEITKSTTTQTITIESFHMMGIYGTSTKEVSFIVPPANTTYPSANSNKVCVKYNDALRSGQPYVLHGGQFKQATMYVFNGTNWIKSHYYS